MWPPAPAPNREAGIVGSRLYWVGSLALHGALAVFLMALPGLGAVQQARSAATEAAAVERRLKDTETRALQQGVRELEQIRRLMDALAGPAAESERPQAASAPAAPTDLAARAQALAAAIEAADRRLQIAELARLTRVPPAEAARQLDAEAKARPPAAPPAEAPAEKVARLQRHAQDVLQRAQAVRAAPEQGVRLARPPLPQRQLALGGGGDADRPTVGGKPGGVADGTAAGVGSEGGRHALGETRLPPPGRGDGLAAASSQAAPGNGLAPTPRPAGPARGAMPSDRHELVARAGPAGTEPAVGPGAGGRTIGPHGVYADRVYLDSWYVIGPFEGRGAQSMQLRYPPEDGVDLEASYRGLEGRLLGWAYASRGFYPFVPPDRAENAVYYAYTELRVAQPLDLWMSFAADDDLKVWLNGQPVWHSEPADKPWYRMPFYFAHEQAASMALAEGSRRVRLEPGVHRMLVKLYNRHNYAFFSIVLSP
jgi:hypothetical protein